MASQKGGSALAKLAARTAPIAVQEGREVEIPLEKICFDRTQPRKAFHHPDGQVAHEDEEKVQGLAAAIEANGQIQAIVVEPVGDGTYRVIIGERRTRAHLLLGRKTIRAIIRDDLKGSSKRRLVFQLAENVAREDLSDQDLAESVRNLMSGDDGEPPMSQVQIAKELGVSEGWVSRYVRYGEESQQRLWVQTGIADSVEKVYRLSILPAAQQVEIQRRVSLPEDDPDFLAKPLNRGVIDEYARKAKIAKVASAGKLASPGFAQQSAAGVSGEGSAESAAGGLAHVEHAETVGRTAEAGGDFNFAPHTVNHQSNPVAGSPQASEVNGGTYKLSDADRAKLRDLAGVSETAEGVKAVPPVQIRTAISDLRAFLKTIDKKDASEVENIQIALSLPGPLAQRIANAVAGFVVEPGEVAATLQRGLSKA